MEPVNTIQVINYCPYCGKEMSVNVDANAYIRWKNRECLIQDAFPDLLPSQREVLMSGTCNECWNMLFNPMDDEQQ